MWLGEKDCRNYKGVKLITGKVCCGGVKRDKVKLECKIHKHIYAKDCKKGLCGYYERRN
jgi:hypothetical protein